MTALTLARPADVKTRGGRRVVLRPNPRGDGIWFKDSRTAARVEAVAANAARDRRTTGLAGGGCRFRRVEHVLSALAGAGVGHAVVELDGPDVPLLDGSALPWLEAITAAGTRRVAARHEPLALRETVEVRDGDRWVRATPSPRLRVAYALHYPGLEEGSRALTVEPRAYRRELAPARTFCGEHEAEAVRAGDPEEFPPVVVFDGAGRADRELRFPDEALRHKLLDLLGDLALVGRPLRAFVEARASGHAHHIELARALAAL